MEKLEKCLYPTCGNLTKARGLCDHHYGIARRFVNKGMITWERLVEQGKATASQTSTKPTHVWFLGDANESKE